MNHKRTLAAQIVRGGGMNQTELEIKYVYVFADGPRVHTKQGNIIKLPSFKAYTDFISELADLTKEELEKPKVTPAVTQEPEPTEGE
jgi:hypothetical protein